MQPLPEAHLDTHIYAQVTMAFIANPVRAFKFDGHGFGH